MKNFPSRARYLENRSLGRERAERKLLEVCPSVSELMALAGEYVATKLFFVSGSNMSAIQNGRYIGDLMVSFTRTYFIAEQLLVQGELIEGATLVRKQIELLARLHELVGVPDHSLLLRRTPNIRHLKTDIKRMYAAYSELAHSSDPRHLQQLGRIKVDDKEWTPLYPVFDPNALVSLRHLVITVVEYHLWSSAFLSRHYGPFNENEATELIDRIVEKYMATLDVS